MGVGVGLGGGFGGGGVVWVVGGAWVLTFFVFAFLQNVIDATLLKFSCHYQQIQTRRDAQEDLSKTIGRHERERPRWDATADILTEQ